ncbi:MAG: hypothetical protein EBY17_30210, partial [Acidobacteriia bacterium]|nr:hypothetical protein [Terriglobia bacterium]
MQAALSELASSQAPEMEELKNRLERLGVHLVGNEVRFGGSHAQAIEHLFTDVLSQLEPVEGKESPPTTSEAFAQLVAKLRQVVPLWEVELLSPATGCPPPGVEAVPGPLTLPADEFTRDGILRMHPGHFGSLVVDRPLIVRGQGTVLWSDGRAPALEVRSPGVTLEDMVIRSRGEQPALRVTPGHSIK